MSNLAQQIFEMNDHDAALDKALENEKRVENPMPYIWIVTLTDDSEISIDTNAHSFIANGMIKVFDRTGKHVMQLGELKNWRNDFGEFRK